LNKHFDNKLIRHLLHTEIDKHRWDQLIDRCANRMPYAYSWWLNVACSGWEALVSDDYTAAMPLSRNRRLGIDYLYQPYFTQQLGIFSPDPLSDDACSSFLTAIPDRYRYIDIQLNTANHPGNKDFRFTTRKNYTLDLSSSYPALSSHYHRNCRRNIQKAIHSGLKVAPGPSPSVFSRFVQRNLHQKLSGPRPTFYPLLQKTTFTSLQNNTGNILGVYDRAGELISSGWFVETAGRYTFLVCASTPAGKEQQAMFLLVDHVIREKAGTALLFDFAGSNLPGIAYFNKGFGAREEFYLSARRNHLPWPLRLLKR
jgi:hypothetical protein